MITQLLELFAFGGIIFWISFASLVFVLTLLTDRNWHFTKLLLIGALVALFWSNVKTLNVTQLTTIIVSYFVIGIIYSFVRWFNQVNTIITKYSLFLKKHNINDVSTINSTVLSFEQKLRKLEDVNLRERDVAYKEVHKEISCDYKTFSKIESDITPTENKVMLYNWIFYWPWSIIRFFTADLAEAIYQLSKNQYKNIVNHLLRKNLN